MVCHFLCPSPCHCHWRRKTPSGLHIYMETVHMQWKCNPAHLKPPTIRCDFLQTKSISAAASKPFNSDIVWRTTRKQCHFQTAIVLTRHREANTRRKWRGPGGTRRPIVRCSAPYKAAFCPPHSWGTKPPKMRHGHTCEMFSNIWPPRASQETGAGVLLVMARCLCQQPIRSSPSN